MGAAMARNVIDRDFGYTRIIRELMNADRAVVEVGIPEAAIHDGLSIAEYGAYNEFGATIEMAARSHQMYKQVNSSGTGYNKGGRFVKKSKSNFASWTTIPAHTVVIPERSFMRSTFDENVDKIQRQMSVQYKLVVEGKRSVYDALLSVGLRHGDDIKRKIRSGINPPNSPRTIAKKKSSKTLIDTGAMLQSITATVKKI